MNASHAMRWADGQGKQHNHTWEIISEFKSAGDHMIIFNDIERTLNDIFQTFSGKFLNELPAFQKINPTVENVTIWLFKLITDALDGLHADLIRLEVGESPTRSYCITVEDDE
ncbi:6-pyruvoyl-tetrahydropterin synthase [Secundilactobacillus similis DSM 23365 = JCM 2765]|uniref:6-carboxy-5,6,7,8-tetrahydropterin synthase n=1 Tax=Secundilactobacillus similis DSM 23365 = JCM 2765 TaxID=1423804 RepID=A0A0R2EY73_9LACO|nr:6-pyruvoyl-tetrahydropterin synthase [Secundilactobacillus similis DSM 23365 = JCM 2765]